MSEPMNPEVPVLVVTGPVGSGKTSVGMAISGMLDAAGITHALVDVDRLTHLYPRSRHDPFARELATKNLAAVWSNYQAAGARCLIISDVVESHTDLERYRSAIPGATTLLVRLQTSLPTLTNRLTARETEDSLGWYLHRAEELAAQMDSDGLEDLLVDTEGKAIIDVAREIWVRSNWANSVASG